MHYVMRVSLENCNQICDVSKEERREGREEEKKEEKKSREVLKKTKDNLH